MVAEVSSDGKFLDCNSTTCNVPKSPKDGQGGTTKKRNRKKKTSECDKDPAQDATDLPENSTHENQVTGREKESSSTFSSLIMVAAVCVAVGAIILSFAVFNDSSSNESIIP